MRKTSTITISQETAASLRMLYALTGKSEQVIVANLIKAEVGRLTQNLSPNDSFALLAKTAASSLRCLPDDSMPVFFSSFVAEHCTVSPTSKVQTSVLYDAYCAYCQDAGYVPASIIVFTNHLQNAGFKRRRGAKASYRLGIALNTSRASLQVYENKQPS